MKKVFKHPNELLSSVGDHLGVSPWLEITQQRINQFADATDDHQWIHVDAEKAKGGPFGACIAHGYLTMSLASYFMPQVFSVDNVAMGINYGVNKVRFPSAVVVNSKVRGSCDLISAEEVKGGVQVIIRVTIELQGSDKPACVVEAISRYFPTS